MCVCMCVCAAGKEGGKFCPADDNYGKTTGGKPGKVGVKCWVDRPAKNTGCLYMTKRSSRAPGGVNKGHDVFAVPYYMPGGKDVEPRQGQIEERLDSFEAACEVARQIDEIRWSKDYGDGYVCGLEAAACDPRFAKYVVLEGSRDPWPDWCY